MLEYSDAAIVAGPNDISPPETAIAFYIDNRKLRFKIDIGRLKVIHNSLEMKSKPRQPRILLLDFCHCLLPDTGPDLCGQ